MLSFFLKLVHTFLYSFSVSEARFVFMHVPPFDPRGTYPSERNWKYLMKLFKRHNVTHLFASHIHGYFSGIWVPYTITGGVGAQLQGSDSQHFFHHYMKVHVNNRRVDLTVRRINAENIMVRFYDLMEDNAMEIGLLLCAGISLFTLWLSVQKRWIFLYKNGKPATHNKIC